MVEFKTSRSPIFPSAKWDCWISRIKEQPPVPANLQNQMFRDLKTSGVFMGRSCNSGRTSRK